MNINEIQRAMLTGGVVDMSDERAPKSVSSRELTAFRLVLFDEKRDSRKTFRIALDGADARYRFSGTDAGGEKINDIDCRADKAELTRLSEIVSECGLAAYNGAHIKAASGEAESFSLEAEYASGERIFAAFRLVNPDGWQNARKRLYAYFEELTKKNGYTLEPSPLKTAITRGGTVVASYLPEKTRGEMKVYLTVEDKNTALEFFVCDVANVTKGSYMSFEISPNEIRGGMSAKNRATGEKVADAALVERAVANGEYNIRLVFDKGESETYRI